MDSVLTSMVDDNSNSYFELEKSLKKIVNTVNISLFRTVVDSFRVLLSQLPKKEDSNIIISALAPISLYNVIKELGFTPKVIDVDLLSGLLDFEAVSKKIDDNTGYIVNYSNHLSPNEESELYSLGVPVIDISDNGLGEDLNGDYKIFSIEDDTVISSMGGAVLAHNNSEVHNNIKDLIQRCNYLTLPGLNCSFALSKIEDIEELKDRKRKLVKLYKDSLLKSGYSTLENKELNIYNQFPVVLKRSLRDVQKYCKDQGVETKRSFEDSIIRSITGLKCKNANSLANKTLLFPIYLGIPKNSVEVILKVLSTLP